MFALALTLAVAPNPPAKEEPEKIEFGDFTKQFRLKEGEVKHFIVTIPSSYDGEQDLVVKVQASD